MGQFYFLGVFGRIVLRRYLEAKNGSKMAHFWSIFDFFATLFGAETFTPYANFLHFFSQKILRFLAKNRQVSGILGVFGGFY